MKKERRRMKRGMGGTREEMGWGKRWVRLRKKGRGWWRTGRQWVKRRWVS